MSKRSLKFGGFGMIAALAAVGIASSLGAQKHAGYLNKIGPGPLRLQAARPQFQPLNLPPLAMSDAPESEPVPAIAMPATAKPAENVNLRAESPPPSAGLADSLFKPGSAVSSVPAVDVRLPQPVVTDPNPAPLPAPASDLLNISPQMLVEYFRPQSGSNAANVSVFVPVNFAPVTPGEPGSSGASYQAP